MLEKDYQEKSRELLELFEKQDYVRCLEITREIRSDFPEHSASACFDTAYIQAMLGEIEDSITTLEEAYDEGAWRTQESLDKFPNIELLKASPRFRRIMKGFRTRHEEERKHSKVGWVVRTPPDYDSARHYPVLFALHWRGSNMKEFEPYWKEGVLRNDIVLVVPQSSQVIGHNEYTWNDVEAGLDDLEHCYNAVKEQIAIDSEVVLLGGASIGGMLALEATFVQNRFPVKGVIAVIPHHINADDLTTRIEELVERDIRCCIVTGTEDSSYEPCKNLASIMEEQEMKHLLIESTGTGHIIPPDFDEMLNEMMPFLLA
ncbi:MAG: alpha/beta hydrolase [Candidatus Thorarchaeota archaeon]